MSIISKLSRLMDCARQAKKESGIAYLQQLLEFYPLTRSPTLLGLSEYFEFRLYDRAFSNNTRHQFLGYKAEQIYSKLNHHSWHGTANDKILYEQVMIAAGLRIPGTLAVYHPWRVAGQYCSHLRTLDDLEQFLTGSPVFPIFVKPVHGLFGRGADLIIGYEPESKMVMAHGQRKIPLREFHSWLESNSRAGMLFQSMLEPSEEVRQICGDRVSSVRMIVLVGADGPKLFRANWKLCTGDNIMDNTEGWTNGNVVAAVDQATGVVQRAYRGINGKQIAIECHPDTEVKLVGLTVPNWDALKDYVVTAAKSFPGLQFQAWDIAATKNGACGIELNLATLHTVYATQLVSHQGFLDHDLATALSPFLTGSK